MLCCHRHLNNCAHTLTLAPKTHAHTHINTPSSTPKLPESHDPGATAPVTYCTGLPHTPAAMWDKSCYHLQYTSTAWVTVWRKCKAGWAHHLHHRHHCRGGSAAGGGDGERPFLAVCGSCVNMYSCFVYFLPVWAPSLSWDSKWRPCLGALCIAVSPWQQALSMTTDFNTSE